jgi:hypothetical protein
MRQLVSRLIFLHFLFIQLYPNNLAIVFVSHVIPHARVKVKELHGKGAKHNFVEILRCELVLKVDARCLGLYLGLLLLFFLLLGGCRPGCLGSPIFVSAGLSLLSLVVLLVLKDVGEAHSRHVGIIGCLVVVRE